MIKLKALFAACSIPQILGSLVLVTMAAGCQTKPAPAVAVSRPSPGVRLNATGKACLRVTATTPENRCATLAPPQQCVPLLERTSADNPTKAADPEQFGPDGNLAVFYLYNGPVEKAVHHFQVEYDRLSALGSSNAENALRGLAISQLRLGETANCLQNHNDESCVVPLSPKARHLDERGSRAAIASFSKLLERYPTDALYRWLLNLAFMTVGEYPAGVPEAYRIPVSAFQSSDSFPRFPNIAPALGVSPQNLVGGVILDDLNGDGNTDIILSSIGLCDPIRLLINNGQNGFDDQTNGSGLDKQLGAGHMIQADYDNDGDLDIYATRGIWEQPGQQDADYGVPVYNTLLENRGDGHFDDVTEKAGLRKGPNYNIASVWADFDNNGRVDLLVCNSFQKPHLFLNRDGKHFDEPAHDTGLVNDQNCMGVASGDVNNDGLADLFLSVHGGQSALYINKGDAHFQRMANDEIGRLERSFSTWFEDYDNDGWLDLFVSAWDAESIEDVGRVASGLPTRAQHLTLFRNHGEGRFQPVEAGLDDAILVMGANFGDFDNDGYEDLLLGTGGPPYEHLLPNRAYRNKSGKGFSDVTFAGGFGNLQKGHGIGFADLDNDGDQDVVASFGGWFETDRFTPSIYLNPGFGNHWVTLRLRGTRANRSAIGSRITLDITEKGQSRSIHRVVSSGGSFGSGSLQVEIGLGKATRIKRMTIRWAGSGTSTVLTNVGVDRILSVTEGKPDFGVEVQPGIQWKMEEAAKGSHHEHGK